MYGVLVKPLPPLDSIVNVFSSDDFPGSAFSKVISSPSVKVIVPIVAVFTTTDLALSFPWTLAVKYANVAFLLICGYYPIIFIIIAAKSFIFDIYLVGFNFQNYILKIKSKLPCTNSAWYISFF